MVFAFSESPSSELETISIQRRAIIEGNCARTPDRDLVSDIHLSSVSSRILELTCLVLGSEMFLPRPRHLPQIRRSVLRH